MGAALHGTAAFATQNTADPKAALDGIDDLVHLLLRGALGGKLKIVADFGDESYVLG
ncbi:MULTISPECIES: hypothetical protein [Streptomyces]|uniref:hypothetical protein n=1 Tax=Streptomyces TaxID=1883 RepID=UPI000A82084D|nr:MULTISPECIES: hypothetical protein [Streptomyces]MDI5912607.1 hypothetical protein [Streptomyces sp. 12257]